MIVAGGRVFFVPNGAITSTNVQAAIEELDREKAAAVHTHDDRYYTETEVNNLLAAYAALSHTHDDRYYTETEVNNLLAAYAALNHTHDDRYYTETEVNNLLTAYAALSHTHTGTLVSRTETKLATDFVTTSTVESTILAHTSQSITTGQRLIVRFFGTSLIIGGSSHYTQDGKISVYDGSTQLSEISGGAYIVSNYYQTSLRGFFLGEFQLTAVGSHTITLKGASRWAGDTLAIYANTYPLVYSAKIITELWQ